MKNSKITTMRLLVAALVLGFGLHALGQSKITTRGLSSTLEPSPADDQVQLTIAKKEALPTSGNDSLNYKRLDMRQAAATGRWPTTSSATSGLGY